MDVIITVTALLGNSLVLLVHLTVLETILTVEKYKSGIDQTCNLYEALKQDQLNMISNMVKPLSFLIGWSDKGIKI